MYIRPLHVLVEVRKVNAHGAQATAPPIVIRIPLKVVNHSVYTQVHVVVICVGKQSSVVLPSVAKPSVVPDIHAPCAQHENQGRLHYAMLGEYLGGALVVVAIGFQLRVVTPDLRVVQCPVDISA